MRALSMKRILAVFSLIALGSLALWAGAIQSLGAVTVTTAGTAVALTSNSILAYSIMVEAVPANSGTYMILEDAQGNIICKFAKAQSCTPPMPSGGIYLSTLKLDSDTNGDKAYVSYSVNF